MHPLHRSPSPSRLPLALGAIVVGICAWGAYPAAAAARVVRTDARLVSPPASHLVSTPPPGTHTVSAIVAAAPSPPPPVMTPEPPVPQQVRAAAPVSLRNHIQSGNGSLDVAFSTYDDCRATAPLPRTAAALDTCIPNRPYFIGHSTGAFAPLLSMGVGMPLTWWDGAGGRHNVRISRIWSRPASDGVSVTAGPGVVAQFQTCKTPDGSIDWIFDTVAA